MHAKKTVSWITLFEIASQRSTSPAYWVTLALMSNIANYLIWNYFWDCDGIDVTLRLSKFSDFCSKHTVGGTGDDIMFHILVIEWVLSLHVIVHCTLEYLTYEIGPSNGLFTGLKGLKKRNIHHQRRNILLANSTHLTPYFRHRIFENFAGWFRLRA